MIDVSQAMDLTSAMIEGVMTLEPPRNKLLASDLFLFRSMNEETQKIKIEMPMQSLDDENGAASPGIVSASPVFADVELRATWKKSGQTFDYNDFVNYVATKKARQFQQNAAFLPDLWDERMLAYLLAGGTSTTCKYDEAADPGAPFFYGTHQAAPGDTANTFSNNVNLSLTSTAIGSLTVDMVRNAVVSLINNVALVPLNEGTLLDVLEPVAIVYCPVMEKLISDAWDSAFYATGNGATETSWQRTRYDVKPRKSAYLQNEIARRVAAGDATLGTNPYNALHLICKPKGDAAALICGVQESYRMQSFLPTATDGQGITSFNLQLVGKNGYAYGLPHFAHRGY